MSNQINTDAIDVRAVLAHGVNITNYAAPSPPQKKINK